MPAAFTRCVKSGGRVRTKKLSNGRFMHICFLGGKSFAGEVKTKKEDLEKDLIRIKGGESMKKTKKQKKEEGLVKSFTESLTFKILEDTIDEAKRTVKVCALVPCISRNNRYYSPEVVESVSGTLTGKKSFADHDQRDTKNLIGRIVSEEFKDGKLYADIKVSKASGIAKSTFQKISEGIITDVSIAADGKTKRVKLGNERVDAVSDLDIKSVDFVTEGGISDAKVLHVWENLKDIPQVEEVKEKMIEDVKALREEYPDLVTEIEEKMKDELDKAKKEVEDLKREKIEKELAAFKEKEISKLEATDKIKDLLRGRVSGKTKDEVSANVEKEFDYIKQATEASKEKAKTEGAPEAKNKKKGDSKVEVMTSESIRENDKIPANLKGRCIEILWSDGSEKVKSFLEGYKITL